MTAQSRLEVTSMKSRPNLSRIVIFGAAAILAIAVAGCKSRSEPKPAAPTPAAPETLDRLSGAYGGAGMTPMQPGQPGETPAGPPPGARVARLRELLKDVPKAVANEDSCRTFCTEWCPKAAKCRLGPFAKVQRCKLLCYDPCMAGLLPQAFVDCGAAADECDAVMSCGRDFVQTLRRARAETGPHGGDAVEGSEDGPEGESGSPPPAAGAPKSAESTPAGAN
ncbi:hypothetical protein K8I61_00960 [bacterium]|nr:hypothetical protein [bacterium]